MSRKHLPRLLFFFLAVTIAALLFKARKIENGPAPATVAVTKVKTFNAESFTLPNGLTVVAVPNHRAPVISHMVWYKVGAVDEVAGKSGLAHFFEHLMFKGTDKFPDGSFSTLIGKWGGNDNAFTTQDYTAYYVNISKTHLEDIMEMEADRMTHLTLTDKVVVSERQVVMEERRQRIENNPSARFRERIMETLYPDGHPYGRPTIGYMPEIEQLSREQALSFYKEWYAPNNAILVVAGDVTAEELKPLAEKYFGAIPAQPDIHQNIPLAKPVLEPKRLTLGDPQVRTPVIQRYYRVHKDSRALEVLAEIFGGSTTSRLYKSLVVDQKLASSAAANYDALSRLDDTLFSIYLMPTQGTSPESVEKALDGQITDLLANGVTKDEVETAKKRLSTSAIYDRDSLQSPAMQFGQALASGLALNDVEYWPSAIDSVTKDQVNTALKAVFNGTSKPVTGILLPEAGEKQ